MLPRVPPAIQIPSSSTATLSLPGLVSSLRPIKRISSQLNDELNLVHRFSYKNKNQHKASVWWKRVIHVDRTLHRTLEEVDSLLSLFGSSKDSDDVPTIQSQQVVAGLMQLPRSLVLVEKSIQVLLNCASILEQLIETKAFLAFILVIISLIARLHSLSLVLHDEVNKLSSVLLNLVEANNLSSIVQPLIARLPKELRKYLVPQRTTSTPLSSVSATPIPESVSVSAQDELGQVVRKADDLGDVIVRKPKKIEPEAEEKVEPPSKKKKRPLPIAQPAQEEDKAPDAQVTMLPPVKKKKKVQEETELETVRAPKETLGSEGTVKPVSRKKRIERDLGGEISSKVVTDGKEEKPKKKKKVRKSMDEIDAIFG
ncbi:uncharacterized protein JCM6883_003099 [Sporobolomyces salmoneus]|uniref:uncharacterized protein n=1 Tax=Sporobolomyces salmoneus TaxID=183962 RepID=UPI0031726203